MSWGLAKLKFALVPLVLSLALRYLLQPMIDALTRTAARRRWRRDAPSKLDEALAKRCGKLGQACVLMKRKCTRLALPYSMAVLVSLALALGLLIFVAMLIAESVRDFTWAARTRTPSKCVYCAAGGGWTLMVFPINGGGRPL